MSSKLSSKANKVVVKVFFVSEHQMDDTEKNLSHDETETAEAQNVSLDRDPIPKIVRIGPVLINIPFRTKFPIFIHSDTSK